MIIWINGTFGSGKTTTAYELHKRLENSFVFDPERVGFVLMRNVPKEIAKADFQDYPIWRETNYTLLKQVTESYTGIIIVPMTLTNEEYFKEIIGRLREDGIIVNHFTISASKETIAKRLRKRFEGEKSWAYQQMETRMSSLSNETFEKHIHTDTLSIEEVVETIARLSSIEILPDQRPKLKKVLDRYRITLKEMGLLK
jgi:adenylate kinase family enzyme